MNTQRMLRFFSARKESGQDMVLATVVETGGSTYSKSGALMLLDGEGNFCGMLSGGCLEGDLAERAQAVIRNNEAQTAHYDLSPDDELWGLGVGCEGTMSVYLQALSVATDYEPFETIIAVLNGREAANVALSDAYSVVVVPSPALLLLGAGADSEPVVNIASEMGWRCVVCDHRPAYIESRNYGGGIGAAAETHCIDADKLSAELDLDSFDMALVMSHHLLSDRAYLTQLAATRLGYIGLLGPPRRRDRILGEIANAADLEGRLYAPAGVQLGGRGPGPIAVEIIAEMQRYLANRSA